MRKVCTYACIKGHLEPTHLKSSPLFTFSTKSSGQDSPSIHLFSKIMVVVVLRSPIHANEPSEYNGMLYRTSNRVLNNGIKVIILICMDGTSQYHHHQNNWVKIHYHENKVGWRFTKLICFFLGQDSLSNKENDKAIKRTFVQDSPYFKYY